MKKNKQLVESYKKRLINSIAEDVNLNEATRYMMPEPTMDPSGGGILGRFGRGLSRWVGGALTRNPFPNIDPGIMRFLRNSAWRNAHGENFFNPMSRAIFRDSTGRIWIKTLNGKGNNVYEVILNADGTYSIGKYGIDPTIPSYGFQHYNPSKGTWGLPGIIGVWYSPQIVAPSLQEPEDDYIDSPPPSSDGPMYAGLSDQGTRNNPYL